jgi:hypothetical protein
MRRPIAFAATMAALAGLLAVSATDVKAVPIVQNSSFEDVIIGSPFFSTDVADVPGWTRSGPVFAFLWGVGYSDPGGSITAAGSGMQFITVGGGFREPISESVHWSQTVSGFTAGQDYVLTFMMASEADFSGAQSLIVSFPAGSSTGPQTFVGPDPVANYWTSWITQTETFHATAESVTLDFSVPIGTQFDVGLDNVQIVPAAVPIAAVPEPASLLVLGPAFVGFAGLAWRRRALT